MSAYLLKTQNAISTLCIKLTFEAKLLHTAMFQFCKVGKGSFGKEYTGSTDVYLQSSKVQLSEYVNLPAESSDEGKTSMVCDRCLQEIDAATFSNNVARLDQLAEEAHAAQNLEHEFTMNLEVWPHSFFVCLGNEIMHLYNGQMGNNFKAS